MANPKPSNTSTSTTAENHLLCAGAMCCLSHLHQRPQILFHPETLAELILSHIHPQWLTLVKEEPENDMSMVSNSMICHQGNESHNSESSIFICNHPSWIKLQFLVQIMSPRWFVIFGSARLLLFPRRESSSAVWHLDKYQPKTIQESKQGQDYIWFCIPTKLSQKFGWLATQKLEMFMRRTVCKESFQEFLCWSECQSSRSLEMVLDVEEDVLFLSCVGSYTNWTDDLIAYYVNEVIPGPSSSFCRNSRTYTQDGTKDVITAANTKTEIAALEFQDNSSCTSYLEELEVQDFEVNHIKEANLKLSTERVVDVYDKRNSDMRSRQNKQRNFRQFLLKYTAHAKRRGYHLVTTEPMLIVQCPGCSAEFRGLTNRMLRLIDHIKSHGPTKSERFMNDIQRRYSVLINLMETRMLKWLS